MPKISIYEQWKNDGLLKDKLFLVESWAKSGLSNADITRNLGITKDTFYQYIKKYPDFSDSLKRGQEITDFRVENALYKRAIGYTYEEIKNRHDKDGNIIETTITTKHVFPDVTACMFWLKNRKPMQWRERQDVQQNVSFADDGFIDALKGKAEEMNQNGKLDFVEE